MESMTLPGGIQLYSYRDTRFKQGALSIQFVCPMKREESAYNALLPAVLLRGTEKHPDLRSITLRLDDLYGAAVSASVRRALRPLACATARSAACNCASSSRITSDSFSFADAPSANKPFCCFIKLPWLSFTKVYLSRISTRNSGVGAGF